MRLCFCSLISDFFFFLQSLNFLDFLSKSEYCFAISSFPFTLEKELTPSALNFPTPATPWPFPQTCWGRQEIKKMLINTIICFLRALEKGGEDPTRTRKSKKKTGRWNNRPTGPNSRTASPDRRVEDPAGQERGGTAGGSCKVRATTECCRNRLLRAECWLTANLRAGNGKAGASSWWC